MKALPWVLCVLVVVALVALRPEKPDGSRLALAQAQLAGLLIDSANHAQQMRELEDSLDRRLAQAHRAQDEVRRLVAKDSASKAVVDSLAALAIAAHDFALLETAFRAERQRADSITRALTISQQATNDALASLAFSRLQRMADSTRIAGFEQAVPVVLQASKRSWWGKAQPYVLVGVGFYAGAKLAQR